jgi:hypothetical protein
LPAAEGDHGPDEQGGQDQQGPAPFQVLDVVGGRLAGLLGHGQLDLLASPKHAAGGVGGVEADLAATGQPGGDLDADRPGHAGVGLLAVEGVTLVRVAETNRVESAWPAVAGRASSPRGQRTTTLASTVRAITPTTANSTR